MFYPEIKNEIKNPLLEGPELVSLEKEKKQEGEMSFSFESPTRRYYLGHKDSKPFFIVEYFNSLPNELNEVEKEKFIKEIKKQDETEKLVYVLKYGEVSEIKEADPEKYYINEPIDFQRDMIENFVADNANKQVMSEILTKHLKLNSEEISKIVEQTFEISYRQDREVAHILLSHFSREIAEKIRNEIREIMLPKPQETDVAQLVEILKEKKVLFYTGAGISEASGVPNMDQLQELLGIEMSEKIDGFFKKAITNPQSVIDSWEEFTKAAFEKPATSAHQSLGILAQKLKSQIFTENLDHLQEKTGVKAIHLTGSWLKENLQPEWLKDIDLVITIGLSFDDRGFLSWYKKNNPTGKIMAINLNQPSYLGNEDFILKGDCQKIIPELEKNL